MKIMEKFTNLLWSNVPVSAGLESEPSIRLAKLAIAACDKLVAGWLHISWLHASILGQLYKFGCLALFPTSDTHSLQSRYCPEIIV